MSADIRPARASDVDALVSIENEVFETDRISRRSFRRLMKSGTASLLVAARNRVVAGYALVLFRKGGSVARLYSIVVSPASASAGLGRSLLEAAEMTAFAHGRPIIRLEVRERNARAISLYERAGYRRIGRRESYYQDGVAALRFEKHLDEQKTA